MSTTTSPLRPPAPRKSPTASQSSPSRARSRPPPRPRPPRTAGPWRCRARAPRRPRRLLALGPQRGQLELQRHHLLAHRLELRLLARRGVARRPQVRGLEVGERVRAVRRGELAQQVLAHPGRLLEHDLRATGVARRRVEPSPNSRAAPWPDPVLGAEDLVDLAPKNSATTRALSVNAASTSRLTFSNSLRTNSASIAFCSRSSTRAPTSIASLDDAPTGFSPASIRRSRRTPQSPDRR